MRLSKLLSKYKGKFATVLGSFFSELKKTTASGNQESKTQKDAYHFAKNIDFDNFYDYDYEQEDDGLFEYEDEIESDFDEDAVNEMEYDAMSAEFYAEFGL